MRPTISIVMPMFGVEAFIARAIESVQQQTFVDWELIIVNDGTKDRSREIASRYQADDRRICIIDKPNGGLTSARLAGLRIAKGEYLSFVDSDDTLQPDYLRVLLDNIKQYDADVSMCSYYTIRGGRPTPQSLYFNDDVTVIEKENVFQSYFLPQMASVSKGSSFLPSFMWLRLFKRSILTEDLFVSEREVYQEDLVFSARIFKRLNRIVVLNRPLYDYYVNSGSLTQRYRENAWSMMQALLRELLYALEDYPEELTAEKSKSSILAAVHYTFMNASRLEFDRFKTVFEQVRSDELVRKATWQFSMFEIKKAYWMLLLALRFRCPGLMYKYNKERL